MSDPLELSEPLRILIADDHALVRGGLSLLIRTLHPETVIQECSNFEKVTRALESAEPIDLLLIDLLMPGMQSVESIHSICRKSPDLPVIVVSVKEEMHLIRQALRAGASGYIPKSSPPDVTLNAIRLVLSGGIYIPPDALELRNFAAHDGTGGDQPRPAPQESATSSSPLTPRQSNVLELIAEGKSNQEVGTELGLTAGTVKMHLSRIYKVLNAKSRTDALAKYNRLRNGKPRPASEKGS